MVPINTVQGQGKYLFKEDWGNNRIGRGTPLITYAFDFGFWTPCSQFKKGTPDMHCADRIIQFFIVIVLMRPVCFVVMSVCIF